MQGSEKIMAGLIAVLIVVIVALGITLLNTKEQIGEVEAERNKIHNARINAFNNQIVAYQKVITKLRHENDSLNEVKQRIRTITIREIDSIVQLPFDGKAEFFAREITELDSSRTRYLSNAD